LELNVPEFQEHPCAYHILRYTPNLVRDEWVNIGVLVFDPLTGARRIRLIEEPSEFARVRRLHPEADEALLRALRDDFERQFTRQNGGFREYLTQLSDTLSNALQLAPQKGVLTEDLDAELDRLYADHVAPPQARSDSRERLSSRGALRSWCNQVLRQARVWERIEKSVSAETYTFSGDPMKLDYSYRRNGTQGFIQTLSVARDPGQAKILAYTAERIRAKLASTEFTAVTDVPLAAARGRHLFVAETLKERGIEAVPVDSFAVWVNKLRPLIREL
jgi:hypothetical protein